MSAKTKRRFGILAGLIALIGVVTFGVAMARRALAVRRLAAVIADIDRSDPGWRYMDLERNRPEVPDDENFAVALAAAFPQFVRSKDPALRALWNEVHFWKDRLVPNVRLTLEQETDLRRLLGPNAAAAPAFLALADFPRGRNVVDGFPDILSSDLRHINQMAPLNDGALDPLGLLAIQDGDVATPLAVFRAQLNAGRSLRDEPLVVSPMVRTRYQRYAVRNLERLLGHAELSADTLAIVRRELAAELLDDPWVSVARAQRAFVDDFLNALRRGTVRISTAKATMLQDYKPTPAERVGDWVNDHLGIEVDTAHAFALELLTRQVATKSLPWRERIAAVDALQAELAAGPSPANWLAHGRMSRCIPLLLATQAKLRTAVAAIAVEQYRSERGHWPASLGGELPDDPYTGRPLLYRRLADGVVVYSVGPDLRDDGGTLTRETGIINPPAGNIGVRLWDVPHRNRPPVDAP